MASALKTKRSNNKSTKCWCY